MLFLMSGVVEQCEISIDMKLQSSNLLCLPKMSILIASNPAGGLQTLIRKAEWVWTFQTPDISSDSHSSWADTNKKKYSSFYCINLMNNDNGDYFRFHADTHTLVLTHIIRTYTIHTQMIIIIHHNRKSNNHLSNSMIRNGMAIDWPAPFKSITIQLIDLLA